MGCAQSKIEMEESVARCRDRKQLLRGAVSSRNAFAAAHSAYAVALKNTGAALSDYAPGESLHPHGHHLTHLHHLSHSASASASSAASASSSSSLAAVAAAAGVGPHPADALRPPPPPPPAAAPLDFSPIQRSASMPADLPLPKPPRKSAKDPLSTLPPDFPIREEDEDDDDDDDEDEDGEEDGHGHEHGAEDEEEEEMEPRRAAAVPPPPPRPPRPKPAGNPVATSPPPPMPESKGMETYDYFFGPEYTVPPPTLGQLEEQVPPSWPERRDLDTDRRPNKVSSADDPVVKNKIAPEKEAAPPRPPPAKPVKKAKQGGGGGSVHHQHAASAGAAVPMESSLKKGKAVAVASVVGQPSLNLVQLLSQLDDHFLHAFLSAHEVSKMLESARMHYHSNFVDERGRIDHSARVMKAITWNRSFKALSSTDVANDANDNFDKDEWETHATILDKMLAWEKKLYDEVKAGELMKIEYQRKVALLNKQKKRSVRPEVLEKTKSAVSHLHTRYIVDMQSMDSTVSEINRLRDHLLYPKLVDLVDGMGKMWGTMYEHHRSQLKIVTGLRAFDISLAPKETSEAHHDRTIQLRDVVREWHSQFQKLMKHQKEYIKALDSWLKLNLIPIESSLKEKVSSPPRQADPPMKKLLYAWNDSLGNLPDELACAAINSFAEVIHNIVVYQEDELKLKHKCDETRKELDRKKRQFDDWHRKYMERRASMGEENTTENGEGVAERKNALETLESRLKEEEENHRKQCKQVREKSLGSLRMHLPELFRSLSEFAFVISEKYKMLWSITQSQE